MVLCYVMITPDGTSLVPTSTNDISHIDKITGSRYTISHSYDSSQPVYTTDGDSRLKVFSLYSNDDIELIREHFHRYNTKSGTYVKYKDMETSWLENISKYYGERKHVSEREREVVDIANRELSYRRNKILEQILNDDQIEE